MVASAKIAVKSIHPQEGSNKQKEPFFILFTTYGHKIDHNSTIGRTEIWLHPSCSSRDSASDELSVIDIKKMADHAVEAELDFDEKQAALFIAS